MGVLYCMVYDRDASLKLAEKNEKKQCTIHGLKTVQKLSVKQWTLHPFNKRHIDDVQKWRNTVSVRANASIR